MFNFNQYASGGLSQTTQNGSMLNDVLNGVSSGSDNGVGGAISGGATLAVDALLFGGLPLSTVLTNVLGFDLATNIGNVLNYGLNSWGATSNPDQMAGNIENRLAPHAVGLMEAYRTDTQKGLNEFSKWIHALIGNAETFRFKHAKATSSKRAYDKVIKWAKDLRASGLYEPVANLKKAGVIINTTTIDYNVTGTFYIDKTYPNTSRSFDVPQFTIDQASLQKALEPIENLEQTGETQKTASFGGIFGLVIGGLLLKKIF